MKQTSLSGYVISEEPKFLLATSPPTMMQRRLALGVTATLLLIFALTAPFATIQLPRIDAFIPILQTVFFVNDLITAVMLFSQFSCSRSLAILMLASGYLFASFIVVAHTSPSPACSRRQGCSARARKVLHGFISSGTSALPQPSCCLRAPRQRAKQGPHAIDTKDNRLERCIGVRAGVRIHMAQHGQGALSFSPIHRARP